MAQPVGPGLIPIEPSTASRDNKRTETSGAVISGEEKVFVSPLEITGGSESESDQDTPVETPTQNIHSNIPSENTDRYFFDG